MSNNATSIMLVTYNRLELTKRMLNNFFQITTSPYHLIIVDNGSADGTVEYLSHLNTKFNSQCMLGCDIIYNRENKGIATGRNQGLKKATQYNDPWLCTLDNDVELPKQWLEQCIDIMTANPKFSIGVNFEGVNYALMTANDKKFQYKVRGNIGTACSVFNRTLFNAIGYFTTEMDLYAHEDADYFCRARLAGYNIGYLLENGIHLGEGENDVGEYREFKTKCSNENLAKFQANCFAYMRKEKSIYYPYQERI